MAKKKRTAASPNAPPPPSATDWIIGIVGVGGVLLSIVAAVIGVLLLFFIGVGMLLGAFAMQRLLRYFKPDSDAPTSRRP